MSQARESESTEVHMNPSDLGSPCPTFDEARRLHLGELARLSPDEKIEWLGEMLELMEWGDAARAGQEPDR